MKILVYSPMFAPSIGGLEAMMSMLSYEFAAAGHAVKVVTTTPSNEIDRLPFTVLRQPSPRELWHAIAWCDVFFQGNVSLKGLWPLLFHPRPFVVSHQGVYQRSDGRLGWQDKLKRLVTQFVVNISASHAVAGKLPGRHTVIPNAYKDDLFKQMPGIIRNRDLVYLGRLVSDKGVELVLQALVMLKESDMTPTLTIIGSGPEEARLRGQVADLQLHDQVKFVGTKQGQELVELLNKHRIMVVPSRWHEPFGIVALEGIACGCVVVGSSGGGLPEAIGPCGETFPNGDAEALTSILSRLLQEPNSLSHYRQHAEEHLAKHKQVIVAQHYLDVMENTLRRAQA